MGGWLRRNAWVAPYALLAPGMLWLAGCLFALMSVCGAHAWRAARDMAGEDDKIIAFGSFLTVAAVMIARQQAPAART